MHNLCFSFLLGITAVPKEIENNAYAKFWGANKVHYGKCGSGVLTINDRMTPAHANDIWRLHSQKQHGLTDRRPVTSRLNWPFRSIIRVKIPSTDVPSTHFDAVDGYRTGCQNVSHCQQYWSLIQDTQTNITIPPSYEMTPVYIPWDKETFVATFFPTFHSYRVLISWVNKGLCYLNLSGITKFKYDRK